MAHTLLLASSSSSRKKLLDQSLIPFTVISQSADESQCDWMLSLPELVQTIAAYKMEHAILPVGAVEGEYCFVLTADTLSQDASNGLTSGQTG